MSNSTFLKEFFNKKDLRGQPNFHIIYPSNAWKLIKLEIYKNQKHDIINMNEISQILSEFTKNTKMFFPKNFLYLEMGNAIHNHIQQNKKVQEKYFTEHSFKVNYKCLLLSGRLDLLSKDYQNLIEIKTSKYKANLRDYYILQVQIYDYMIYSYYKIKIKNKIILVISNNEISEYKIKSNFIRIETLLNYYIKCIHLFEKNKSCERVNLDFSQNKCDFEKYKKKSCIK